MRSLPILIFALLVALIVPHAVSAEVAVTYPQNYYDLGIQSDFYYQKAVTATMGSWQLQYASMVSASELRRQTILMEKQNELIAEQNELIKRQMLGWNNFTCWNGVEGNNSLSVPCSIANSKEKWNIEVDNK